MGINSGRDSRIRDLDEGAEIFSHRHGTPASITPGAIGRREAAAKIIIRNAADLGGLFTAAFQGKEWVWRGDLFPGIGPRVLHGRLDVAIEVFLIHMFI
ncbi:hypothetical protein [Cupriavidus sp. USMAHM13]|uniref:hypothetical protein n=1 Tax=Cupriavidus sp. USMAHM13 TaxID=1389192 RepID=UPI0012EA0B33|nr:hypothetical protein [Cupriavidus sp. USMAHM13]